MKLPKLYSFKLSILCCITSFASVFHPKAQRLHCRLTDISKYLSCDGLFTEITSKQKIKFNGRVAYAAHSAGHFHPSGYTSRTSSLLSNLKILNVDMYPVVRPGYPTDIGFKVALSDNTCDDNSGLRFQLFPDNPETIRSPESDYITSYSDVLYEYCKREQVSVIHAASKYLNGSAAALAGRRLGIASVYEMRGLWHLTRAFYHPGYYGSDLFRYCEKREVDTCRGVDHVITLSDGLKNWLIKRGIPENKISVVGNAAPSIDMSKNNSQAIETLRSKYQLDPSRKIVGYLGSVVEYEGLDRLIKLMSRVGKSVRPYLMIVGDGKSRKSLIKQARKLGVEADVIFTGRVTSDLVSAYYDLFDVAALPRWDSELTQLVPPIKPFEIVAHGCPLLVSEPVAQALGTTLKDGFMSVDFDAISDINVLIALAGEVQAAPSKVPTWNDRAKTIISIYQSLS